MGKMKKSSLFSGNMGKGISPLRYLMKIEGGNRGETYHRGKGNLRGKWAGNRIIN